MSSLSYLPIKPVAIALVIALGGCVHPEIVTVEQTEGVWAEEITSTPEAPLDGNKIANEFPDKRFAVVTDGKLFVTGTLASITFPQGKGHIVIGRRFRRIDAEKFVGKLNQRIAVSGP